MSDAVTITLALIVGVLAVVHVWSEQATRKLDLEREIREDELQEHVEYLHEYVLAAYEADSYLGYVSDETMMHAERARVLTDAAYVECAYGSDDEEE